MNANNPIAAYAAAVDAGTTTSGDALHLAAQHYADTIDSTVSIELAAFYEEVRASA